MLEQYATWLGWGVMAAGGLLLMTGLLAVAIGVINTLGQKLWNKLLALYDLSTLRVHLQHLESQGRTLRKTERDND